MKTISHISAGHAADTSPAQLLLPGLIIGVMFLLISAVSLSGNDKAILVRQIAKEQADGSPSLAAVASTLRVPERRNAIREEEIVIESAIQSLETAQTLLADPDLLTAADRVTLSMSARDSGLSTVGSEATGQQLAQILSRRMDALELRTVIRVSRAEDLESALKLAESMLAAGSLSADQIGIGIDAALKSDTISFEILRSIYPMEVQETLP